MDATRRYDQHHDLDHVEHDVVRGPERACGRAHAGVPTPIRPTTRADGRRRCSFACRPSKRDDDRMTAVVTVRVLRA
jgi:hypothetical protein